MNNPVLHFSMVANFGACETSLLHHQPIRHNSKANYYLRDHICIVIWKQKIHKTKVKQIKHDSNHTILEITKVNYQECANYMITSTKNQKYQSWIHY